AQAFGRELGIFTDGTDPSIFLSYILIARGEFDSAHRILDEGLDVGGSSGRELSARMHLGMMRGDRDTALEYARTIASGRAPWTDVVAEAADVLVELGDRGAAEELRVRLERSEMDAPWALQVIARVVALLTNDKAAAERAVALADVSPRVLLRARTYESMSKVLRSDELRARSVEIYERVGAIAFADRARTRERIRSTPRPVSGWDALTPAERDVVMLVGEGLTNKQIGERLFVSHRTVATHLAHAFDKLAIRSRVQLARAVAERTASGG
ncbi:MAG: response regulator transcription factor, partial [Acidimicrobiia bacterium]